MFHHKNSSVEQFLYKHCELETVSEYLNFTNIVCLIDDLVIYVGDPHNLDDIDVEVVREYTAYNVKLHIASVGIR